VCFDYGGLAESKEILRTEANLMNLNSGYFYIRSVGKSSHHRLHNFVIIGLTRQTVTRCLRECRKFTF